MNELAGAIFNISPEPTPFVSAANASPPAHDWILPDSALYDEARRLNGEKSLGDRRTRGYRLIQKWFADQKTWAADDTFCRAVEFTFRRIQSHDR